MALQVYQIRPSVIVKWVEKNGRLVGIVHVITAKGCPWRFSLAAPLRDIEQVVERWAARKSQGSPESAQIGFWGSIKKFVKKTAKKIAKNKILKQAARITKSVVKSKITAAAVATLAVAFPPAGIPAAGALAAANLTINQIEKAQAAAKEAKRLGKKIPAKAKRELARINKLGRAAKRGNKHAQKAVKALAIAKRYRKNVARRAREVDARARAARPKRTIKSRLAKALQRKRVARALTAQARRLPKGHPLRRAVEQRMRRAAPKRRPDPAKMRRLIARARRLPKGHPARAAIERRVRQLRVAGVVGSTLPTYVGSTLPTYVGTGRRVALPSFAA